MKWRVIIGLIILYGLYLLFGAGVFYALEYTNEETKCLATIQEINEVYEKVGGNLSVLLSPTREPRNITLDDFLNLVQLIRTASQNGVQFDSNQQPSCAYNWLFQNAFFFSGTVITTIGYGNITPSTYGGQLFCMFYALLGIPMFGLMFAGIGGKIANICNRIEEKIKKLAHKKDQKIIQKSRNQKLLVFILTLLSLILFCIVIPSFIFQYVEDWTYHESFYYSFITLTTIGFGDFVVGSNPDKSYPSIYRILVYFWILFGLAFMATVITLASDVIKDWAPDRIKSAKKAEGRYVIDDTTNSKPNIVSDVIECENVTEIGSPTQ